MVFEKKMRKRRVSALSHMESKFLINFTNKVVWVVMRSTADDDSPMESLRGWPFSLLESLHWQPFFLSWNPLAFHVTSFPFDTHFMSFYSTHRLGDFQTLAPSLFSYQDWLLGNQSAPLLLPPAGSQLTVLAEQVKQSSIQIRSVLKELGWKQEGENMWTKNNAEGSCSRQFCLIQVEENNQVRVLRPNAILDIIPKLFYFLVMASDALLLNDLSKVRWKQSCS